MTVPVCAGTWCHKDARGTDYFCREHQDILVSTSMRGDIVAYCLFYYIFFIFILFANEIGKLTNIYIYLFI